MSARADELVVMFLLLSVEVVGEEFLSAWGADS